MAAPKSFSVFLDPNFIITGGDDEYFTMTGTKREEVVGKNIFEVFPETPESAAAEGGKTLRKSLLKVVRTGQSDEMPVVRWDIETKGGTFAVRYWKVVNTPILENGILTGIENRAEDVTYDAETKILEEQAELARKAYVRDHPMVLTIALSAFLSAIILLALPNIENSSALDVLLPRWMEVLWVVVYGIGGAMAAYGIYRRQPRYEVTGLILLSSSLLIDIVAIYVYRGAGGGLVSTVLFGTSIGAAIRALGLTRRHKNRKGTER